jgi:hypothetical protein
MAKKSQKKSNVSDLKRRSRNEIGKIPPVKVVPSGKRYIRKKNQPDETSD